jgi:hypothetical protein
MSAYLSAFAGKADNVTSSPLPQAALKSCVRKPFTVS